MPGLVNISLGNAGAVGSLESQRKPGRWNCEQKPVDTPFMISTHRLSEVALNLEPGEGTEKGSCWQSLFPFLTVTAANCYKL